MSQTQKGSVEDLKVWQKARELNREVYKLSDTKDIASDNDLKHKMRGLSFSILSNLTKGYEKRWYKNEYMRYLIFAKDACVSFQAFLYLLKDLDRISEKSFEKFHESALDIVKMSSALTKAIAQPKEAASEK
jgi:four helix bundle protein